MTMEYRLTEATDWKHWVTPKPSREAAVHRWYLFPHSFTGNLVHALIDEWKLSDRDRILDPFVGAGTTLLAAKERCIPSTGYDLSPLSVLVTNTKTAPLSRCRLESAWRALESQIAVIRPTVPRRKYSELVRMALSDGRLEAFDAVAARVDELDYSATERDFFRLALISLIPRFSNAVANGGWLRWSNEGANASSVAECFKTRVEMMLSDVREDACSDSNCWKAAIADARVLPDCDEAYSAVITSPPYPNRHDYTRVFGVELMFDFLDWEQNRDLRYQSLHSHPEARPQRPSATEYKPPERLEQSISHVTDRRMRRMLEGYFLDMYLCLREAARVCRENARIAFVVGNARYGGKSILVDEFTAELGERAGLVCREVRAVRWRGNSAQQMGRYGRVASRESVVMFEKRGVTRSASVTCEENERSTTLTSASVRSE